jgi:pimeloyl-ACP methyl ester carboxylesterase/lysophospholipase L1-like esterase
LDYYFFDGWIYTMKRFTPVILLAATLYGTIAMPDECVFPDNVARWNGHAIHEFDVDGRTCKVVCPDHAASGNPWVWRARFWGHEPQADLQLLSLGFHVVYMDAAGLFGNSAAVSHWDAFYEYLMKQHGFGDKPVLEGMSRGGLIVYNWAIANPEKVACIYADAPVLDIASWPGGKGAGDGSSGDWRACLDAYGLSEADAPAFRGNPLDNLALLAKWHVPLLHVVGAADTVVPVAENTAVLEARYRELGGEIAVISKPGVGHHPHSLKDPKPIVDFVTAHTDSFSTNYFDLRDGIANAGTIFTQTKKGRVAFLGGSITEMDGWRRLVCEELQRRFPGTEFDFVDAGVSSTDSTLGSFRLERDVFSRGQVDLLFVEFAVNDRHNSRSSVDRIRGMEGIIRHARRRNPNIDIIVQYFVEPVKMDFYNRGKVPPVIAAHDRVTDYYGIPAINLAREVTERIARGDFTWEGDFKNLHPSPFGHRLYAHRIGRLFDVAWAGKDLGRAEVTAHAMPQEPLEPLNYEHGRYVDIQTAEIARGWEYIENWVPADKAGKRKQFVNVPVMEAAGAGAELNLEFEGTAVGMLVTAGPDAGIVEYSIDGKPYPPLDQFTEWSRGLHIPWAYMLATDLAPGRHTLALRTAGKKNEASIGNTCRIQQFLVN